MFKRKSKGDKSRVLPVVYVPTNIEEQSRQAAMAIERAFQDGITRQTVRLALVNTSETEEIGVEDEDFVGGAKQMYRESGKPLTTALLNEVRAIATNIQSEEEKKNGAGKELFPPTIKSQDISSRQRITWKYVYCKEMENAMASCCMCLLVISFFFMSVCTIKPQLKYNYRSYLNI